VEIASLVLEYLKTLLSLPVVGGAVALIFFGVFKEDIKALMLRVASINLPGGIGVTTSQADQEGLDRAIGKKEPPVPTEQLVNLPAQLNPRAVEDLVRAERAAAALWEYRYLNYYLVQGPQRVLDWLAGLPNPASLRFYDSFWLPLIPSAIERQSIINALQQHNLVALHDDLIEVTPKGHEYLQWRGPLPPLVPYPMPSSTATRAIGRALAAKPLDKK